MKKNKQAKSCYEVVEAMQAKFAVRGMLEAAADGGDPSGSENK